MQPLSPGDRSTWKVVIGDDVGNPRGLAARPHASRKPDAAREGHPTADGSELGHRDRRLMPGVHAAQHIGMGVQVPHRAMVPVERFANSLEDARHRFREGCRFGKRAGADVFSCERGLRVPFALTVGWHGHLSEVGSPDVRQIIRAR